MPDRVNDVIVLLRLEESITNLNICSIQQQFIANGWSQSGCLVWEEKEEKIGKMRKIVYELFCSFVEFFDNQMMQGKRTLF